MIKNIKFFFLTMIIVGIFAETAEAQSLSGGAGSVPAGNSGQIQTNISGIFAGAAGSNVDGSGGIQMGVGYRDFYIGGGIGTPIWTFLGANGNLYGDGYSIGSVSRLLSGVYAQKISVNLTTLSIQTAAPSAPTAGYINLYALKGAGSCTIVVQTSTNTLTLGTVAGGGC